MSATDEYEVNDHEAHERTVHIGPPLDPDQTVVRPAGAAAPMPDSAPDPGQGLGERQGGRSGVPRRSVSSMPRVYGPRAVSASQAPEPAPDPAGGVAVANPRAALPSLARRDRRARVVTLGCYAAAWVITGVGLWGVATIAFTG